MLILFNFGNERYDELIKKQDELLKQKKDKESKATKLQAFVFGLKETEDKLKDWNEMVWMLLVESAVVSRNKSIVFKYYNN